MNVWPRSTNSQNSNRMDCNNFELLSQPRLFYDSWDWDECVPKWSFGR